ncbi:MULTISPECIES: autotransporter domain-containing protein [Providencia]|uniref:autotransporter domain-containing protein n=2 Tax=Morganellaceae TaxID=1903414 RepID=UPI000D8629AA|nr:MULTISPECIES: autotransporter domain-containing protein [Providencia]MTC56544.1 autotransporter outer membrane beta-barrel domain-containing protein [Providencia rustigianii]SPY78805.1 Extracellular serine protease precursor [Providencia rustigianii]
MIKAFPKKIFKTEKKSLAKLIITSILFSPSYVYGISKKHNPEFYLNWGFNSISSKNAYDLGYTGENISVGLVDADFPSGISDLNNKLIYVNDKNNIYSHTDAFMINDQIPSNFHISDYAFGVKHAVIISGLQNGKGIIGIASKSKIYAQDDRNSLYGLIDNYPVRVINHNGTLEKDQDYDVSKKNVQLISINNIDNSHSSIDSLNYKEKTNKATPLLFLTSTKIAPGLTIKNFVDVENDSISLINGKKIPINMRDAQLGIMGQLHSIKSSSKKNILNVFPVGDFNHYNQPGILAGLPIVYPELIKNTLAVSNITPVRSQGLNITNPDNIFITSSGDKYQHISYLDKPYLREVDLAVGEIDYLWELKNNQLIRTNVILNDEFTKKTLHTTSSQCGYAALWCVSAPGTEIYSSTLRTSKIDDQMNLLHEDYGYSTGSSLSAAHTSGAAAVLMQRFPYMDSADISLVLKTTATDLDEHGVVANNPKIIDRYFGWGEINLANAIKGPSMFASANDVEVMLADDLKTELGDDLKLLTESFGSGMFIANIQQGAIYDKGTPRERSCNTTECLYDKWENDISGSGGLIKRGTGTLELAGKNNSYTGTTEIEAGQLIISGSTRSDINVYNTGILSGSGSASNIHIYQGGTFAPTQYGQLSTFTIDGDITFDRNSTFSAQLAPTTNQIDQLAVTGKVYIDNAAINLYSQESSQSLTASDMQTYQGKYYTFITAEQGIEGEFSNDTINVLKTDNVTPEIFKSKDTNAYHLIFDNKNKSESTLTDLDNKMTLHHTTFKPYAKAIQQKAKKASEIHSSIIAEQFNNHRRVRDQITEHLNEREPQTDGIHTWASILHNSSYAENYTHRHHGLIIGSNKTINNWSIGMIGAYIDGNLRDQNHNSAHQSSHHIGGYTEYSKDNWAFVNGATYSFDQYKTLVADTYDGQFNADYHSHSTQIFTTLSKQFNWNTIQIEPTGSLSYTSIWSPAIKQSNGFYQLESAKTRNHILSSSLGSKIAKTWKFDDKLAIKTYVGAAWLHTYGDAQNGGSFQYNTNNPLINNQVDGAKSVIPMIKNGTQLNVGASIPLMENAEMSVNYSGVLSKKYQEHGGTLNIGWHF